MDPIDGLSEDYLAAIVVYTDAEVVVVCYILID